jgi:hypothetical protein
MQFTRHAGTLDGCRPRPQATKQVNVVHGGRDEIRKVLQKSKLRFGPATSQGIEEKNARGNVWSGRDHATE